MQRKTTERNCHSRQITSRVLNYQHDWRRGPRHLIATAHVRHLPFLPVPSGRKSVCTCRLTDWDLLSSSMRVGYLQKLLGVPLRGRCVYSPLFIHIGVIYFGYNPIMLYFSCSGCSFGGSFIWLLCPFDTPPSLCVCMCVCGTFLLSVLVRRFRIIFFISWPSSRISCFSKEC